MNGQQIFHLLIKLSFFLLKLQRKNEREKSRSSFSSLHKKYLFFSIIIIYFILLQNPNKQSLNNCVFLFELMLRKINDISKDSSKKKNGDPFIKGWFIFWVLVGFKNNNEFWKKASYLLRINNIYKLCY